MKAMGVGLGAFEFHDVWVQRADSGRPTLAVTGRAEQIANELGVTDWHLSITHTDTTAIAYVIAVRSLL
jgi:holo-[acyl-carrier protein] synthase